MQHWKRAVPCMKSARTAAKMKEGIDQLLANKVLFTWLFCWKNVIEYQPKLSLFVMTNIGHSNLSAKLGKYGILNIIHPLFDILNPDISFAHRLFDLGWSWGKILQLTLQVFNLFTWLIHLIRRLSFVRLCVLQSRFQPWKKKKKKKYSLLTVKVIIHLKKPHCSAVNVINEIFLPLIWRRTVCNSDSFRDFFMASLNSSLSFSLLDFKALSCLSFQRAAFFSKSLKTQNLRDLSYRLSYLKFVYRDPPEMRPDFW